MAGRRPLSIVQFYAPSLAVFAAASATYTNLAVGTAIARDEGILKRFRGTPLPPWVYLAGRIGSAMWIAALAVVVMLGVGVAAYGLEIQAGHAARRGRHLRGRGGLLRLPRAWRWPVVAKTGDAAPALANFTILPLAFISDVFLPLERPAAWLATVGDVFPLKHFARSLPGCLQPVHQRTAGSGGGRWR